ncbi:hypothetical protein BDF19DRAFT_446574 [Syncephalis fuscata]|nr:hypothetical protein BDF19DRAFT_446574 [Syncephalis fuscata]
MANSNAMYRHYSLVSLSLPMIHFAAAVLALLLTRNSVDATLTLSWITGFEVAVSTAIWFEHNSEPYGYKSIPDGRALLVHIDSSCKPKWPIKTLSQVDTGWAELKETLAVVAFEEKEEHPLLHKCSSHLEIIHNIMATKQSRRLEGIILPSQNPVPGGPNERYCGSWLELPCRQPLLKAYSANHTDALLSIAFYSPLRAAQLAEVLSSTDTESVRAILTEESGQWLQILENVGLLGLVYSFVGMAVLFLMYGVYRLRVLWLQKELNSTVANWIYTLCLIGLLSRGIGEIPALPATPRAILLALSNLLTTLGESALIIFWAKVMLRQKRMSRRIHYVASVLNMLYGIAACALHLAPKPTVWLVMVGWLASGTWSISALAIGAITRLAFFGAFLFFVLLFRQQRRRVAITWTTRETTLRLMQLSTVQCATHLILGVILLAGLAQPDLRRTPNNAIPLHIVSMLMHIAQNASIILLLRPPVEESSTHDRFVSLDHSLTKYSHSDIQTPQTAKFSARLATDYTSRKDSALSLDA